MSNLDAKLENITQALEHEVFQVRQFVQLYLQLDASIQTLRYLIWQANSNMEHTQLQVNRLSSGYLTPSIITPKSLKALPIEIENHLPQSSHLPYDPIGEIWKLYQALDYNTILDKGQFLVIISIP